MIDTPDLLIYTEASPEVGHGHVTRCAAIADEARRRGLQAGFIVSDAYSEALVAGMGGRVMAEPTPSAPYVVRDFRDGSPVEAVQRHQSDGSRVLLLDDLAEARTVADVVCDCLMTADRAARYPHADSVVYLYGLAYAPLRSEFVRIRDRQHREKNEDKTRLLVSFGGGDRRGVTLRFVKALDASGYRGPATIIIDAAFRREVDTIAAKWSETVVVTSVGKMAEAISAADLVATKLGLTVLESFCLGVGCVLIEPTRAHLDLEHLLEANYPGWPAMELGMEDEVDFLAAASVTLARLTDRDKLAELGTVGSTLVDGRGTMRILDALVGDDG